MWIVGRSEIPSLVGEYLAYGRKVRGEDWPLACHVFKKFHWRRMVYRDLRFRRIRNDEHVRDGLPERNILVWNAAYDTNIRHRSIHTFEPRDVLLGPSDEDHLHVRNKTRRFCECVHAFPRIEMPGIDRDASVPPKSKRLSRGFFVQLLERVDIDCTARDDDALARN